VAVVKNKTGDTLSLFSPDAPPIDPGGEVTVSDENFAERAWPHETWELVEPPGSGYVDASLDDAYLFVPAPEKPAKKTAKKTAAKGDS
jgi:hypothetical protein